MKSKTCLTPKDLCCRFQQKERRTLKRNLSTIPHTKAALVYFFCVMFLQIFTVVYMRYKAKFLALSVQSCVDRPLTTSAEFSPTYSQTVASGSRVGAMCLHGQGKSSFLGRVIFLRAIWACAVAHKSVLRL